MNVKIIGLIVFVFLLIIISFGKLFPKDYPTMSKPLIDLSITKSVPKKTILTEAIYPSQVINLTNWKLTLPMGQIKNAAEIKQPELATYKLDPWFVLKGNGVRFRAPVNGVTTSGSNYPRSELREMINNGKDKASWSSKVGTHVLLIEEAITAVPNKKKEIVAAQVHDETRDIIFIRLEYLRLYVNVNGKNVYTLDSSYTLGKHFKVKFVINNGQTKVYYNDDVSSVYTLSKDYSGAYFKAGAYTQSNCDKEQSSSLCNENNYGEVVIYSIDAFHN